LREEHRPRVLRRIFGPKRDELGWEWRKLYDEELNDLYSSSSIFPIPNSTTAWWGLGLLQGFPPSFPV